MEATMNEAITINTEQQAKEAWNKFDRLMQMVSIHPGLITKFDEEIVALGDALDAYSERQMEAAQ